MITPEIELSFMMAIYESNEQDQASVSLEVRSGVVSNEIPIPFLVCLTSGSAQCESITQKFRA